MLISKTTEISAEIAELRFQKPDFGFQSGNGIRVVLVVARKGGAGKSTLCRALASAAVARGETVTLLDTDISRSCHDWAGRAQASEPANNPMNQPEGTKLMDDKVLSLNIGRPVAWMLDPIDASNVLGVTYAFSITGEHVTVWYTETGEPAQEYKLVETWDVVVDPASLARSD